VGFGFAGVVVAGRVHCRCCLGGRWRIPAEEVLARRGRAEEALGVFDCVGEVVGWTEAVARRELPGDQRRFRCRRGYFR